MKKILLITILALATSLSGFSQDVNKYKYVIVPTQFEFLKGEDQYQLNSLTKFLFEKHGFEVLSEGDKLPSELANNRCKALTAFVKENSGLLSTKLIVGLKDCYNAEVFLSEEGMSRTKQYKQAYHEALREAFKSIEALNYHYDDSNLQIAENKEELLKAEVPESTQMEEKMPTAVAEVVAFPAVNNSQVADAKSVEKVVEKVTPQSKDTSVGMKSSELTFTNNGTNFYLKKSDKGYNFYQEGMAEPFAALIASNKENSFIYSSITNQGVAYFQENGNLVVEVLDRSTNTTNSKIFKIQD